MNERIDDLYMDKMNTFYGFDLGDAESSVACLRSGAGQTTDAPEIIPVSGSKSFITAYASMPDGQTMIGETACYEPKAIKRRIRFKSRFLSDPTIRSDVRAFASGVLGSLYMSGDLVKGDDSCFYVGCPAGWDANDRELYREIFEKCGYPPVKIISESRAALISACQSKHLQIGYDILSRPLLVIDIGSSTTDYAYINGGREVEMRTAGEVALGGGLMDEQLLRLSVEASSHADRIRSILTESEPWRNYCEFAARRLKERYYSDPDYWADNDCTETVRILSPLPLRLTLTMNKKIARQLEDGAMPSLGGASWRGVYTRSLENVRAHIREDESGKDPELIFLTGGVSKLPAVRDWCREVFPDTIVISGTEPEFSVARGLAWSGSIDERLRAFRADLKALIDSDKVEQIVEAHLPDLYRRAVDALVDPLIEHAAVPVFDRWRRGEIKRLSDTEEAMQEAVSAFLHSDEARSLMTEPVSKWLRPVADELEEFTQPICIRHGVPYTALSLSSYLSLSDLDIRIEAKQLFAVSEITLIIDSLIAILTSLLCGGSGIALISSGLSGIIAGAMLSLIVLLLGRNRMEKQLLGMNIPRPLRKLVPSGALRARMPQISASVKEKVHQNLATSKSEEISERMVKEISSQIENALVKMAEIVEIPIG